MAEHKHIAQLRGAGPAYEADYAAWLDHQIGLMKAGAWEALDAENLIDEVQSLGNSDYKGFASSIEIVLIHMLKWDYQPERRTRSWQASIIAHRLQVSDELADSPSYKARIPEAVGRSYRRARARASGETGLPLAAFPEECPYEWDAIITREHPLDGDA